MPLLRSFPVTLFYKMSSESIMTKIINKTFFMKRLLLSFMLTAVLSTFKSYASETVVPAVIMESFEHSFAHAQNITTLETSSFYRIGFTLNNTTRFVYYDLSGNLLVSACQISFDELPKVLQADLKNTYGDLEPKESYKLVNESGTEYCVVIEKGNKEITLEARGRRWKEVNIEQGTRNIE